jgi:hypothetical protein
MATRAYFLMPNFDYPPDISVRLGQVISDLNSPTTPLLGTPHAAPSTTQHSSKTNWESEKLKVRSGKIGVWTQFLAPILGWEKEDGEILKFETLDTYFLSRIWRM